MKKFKSIILVLSGIVLSSCVKTNEVYSIHDYDTGEFETNYYLEHKGPKDEEIVEHLPLVTNSYNEDPKNKKGTEKQFEHMKNEDQMIGDKYLLWDYSTPGTDYNRGYGPTKNLANIDASFKEGIMSKLYDGRVRCDGRTFARTRVQLNKTGYSTYFPKQMVTGKYFGVALRGQTSFNGSESESYVDLHISFYQKVSGRYRALDFNLNNVNVHSNTHGQTSFVYFYFDEVFQENGISNYQEYLNGISAMSMTFELKSFDLSPYDAEKGAPVDDMTNTSAPHYSLMLYEVMLPESTWR